ncbi:MAG TPA: zinc ribbon domain-containing protein [Conexibacter sp.]|nr:zinc ribbon domain-containing protein [Conexibacter sp.]
MSAPFTVPSCRVCGHLAYPPRILCPECGANDWTRTLADSGIVTEVTVRRPVFKRRQLPWGNWLDQEAVRLASVHAEVGERSVRIIARVPEGVETGDRVTLVAQASTAIALPGQVVEAAPERAPAAPAAGAPAATPESE